MRYWNMSRKFLVSFSFVYQESTYSIRFSFTFNFTFWKQDSIKTEVYTFVYQKLIWALFHKTSPKSDLFFLIFYFF